MRRRQGREHLAHRAARAVVERAKGLAPFGRERQAGLASVVLGGLALHQALPAQALEEAAEVTKIEVEFRAERARSALAALPELIQYARLRQRERAAEVARLQRADAPRVEAVEAPHGVDPGHARCSAQILAFVK